MTYDGSGDKFYMAMEDKVMVHEAEDARLLCELENSKRVLCVEPGEVSFLAILYWFLFSFLFASFLHFSVCTSSCEYIVLHLFTLVVCKNPNIAFFTSICNYLHCTKLYMSAIYLRLLVLGGILNH